jgi:hypothetical protein
MRKSTHKPMHPHIHGMVCQARSMAKYAANPASEFSCSELLAVVGALMQAAYEIELCVASMEGYGPDDHGRAA